MYRCETWIIKKIECWRIDAFELWCWRRLLRVPWTAKRSNQSILREINPEYSLEGLMLKLKLQYFGHLMQRVNPLKKTLMLGKIEGRRKRGWQRMRWLDSIIGSVDMSFSKLREMVKDREAWCVAVREVTVRYDWANKQQVLDPEESFLKVVNCSEEIDTNSWPIKIMVFKEKLYFGRLSFKKIGDFWTKGYGSALLAGEAMSSDDFPCV